MKGSPGSGWGGTLIVALLALSATPLRGAPRLDSAPAGAHVRLDGPITLSGTTPMPLDGLPAGSYRLEAQGEGTGWIRGDLNLDGAGGIRTHRPPSPTAFLMPPGILHLQEHETWRGWILFTGGALSAAGVAIEEASRRDAVSEVNQATEEYERAVTEETIRSTGLRLQRAMDDKADREEMRNLWGATLASVWVGAALENWLLTPSMEVDGSGAAGYVLRLPAAGASAGALRSALVPGSGQRFLGHQGRGNMFTAAVLSLTAGTLLAQQSFLEARSDQRDLQRRYDSAETEDTAARYRTRLEDASQRTRDRSRLRWAALGATAGVYLWNVLDAATLGRNAGEIPEVQLSVLPAGDGFRTGLTWRLPS